VSPDPDALLSVAQTAQRLGISKGYVYKLIDSGVLAAIRIALPGARGVLRIEPEALDAYRDRLRQEARRVPVAVDPDSILRELRTRTQSRR